MKEKHVTTKENKNPFKHEIIKGEVGRLLHSVSIAALCDLDVNLSEKGKGPRLWSWSSLLAVLAKLIGLFTLCAERGDAG
jgi:hypothetical protein